MRRKTRPRTIDPVKVYGGARVLITGGLGFIGSTLAHRLVELGAVVDLVDALVPGCGGNPFNIDRIRDRVGVHIADIDDRELTETMVRGCDFIFNLAGHVSHTDSLTDPQLDLRINCRCPLVLLEACRKHNPSAAVLFAGTRGQYGRTVKLPVTESHPLRPIDVNGVNKLASEMHHLLYHRLWGLRVCSLRLTNTFGPRHIMRHSRQGFLNWFVRLAMDDETIPIYGDGKQLRDFNYVDDVVEAMLAALAGEETSGRAFNLGGGRPLSLLESARAVIAACGGGRIEHVPFPPEKQAIEVGDYWADHSLFTSVTGWEPVVGFEEGLRRTVTFYREHREHYWGPGDDPDA